MRVAFEKKEEHPVPPGQLSQSVLVTNLANRVQPIIRYKMGDRVTISPDTCPCGSSFPVIHVIGRTDEILSLPTLHGEIVQILPLALVTVAAELSLCQRSPSFHPIQRTLLIFSVVHDPISCKHFLVTERSPCHHMTLTISANIRSLQIG